LEPDEEALARVAVLDHRDVEAEETACEQCEACLAGELGNCANPRGTAVVGLNAPAQPKLFSRLRSILSRAMTDPAPTEEPEVDALDAWRSRATANIDASSPLALARDSVLEDDTWYEVVGYDVSDPKRPAVMLRPDWRLPGHRWGPGHHPDLHAGDHLEVVVDSTIRDHSGDLRILLRADSGGRFLLREADYDPTRQDEHAQLAASLNRRQTGQLADLQRGATLTATILPRTQDGHFTITLLDLLHHHLEESARHTPGQSRYGRNTPATVTGTPNNAGYVNITLLARDPARGIRHVFSAPAGKNPPPDGAPVLVDLSRDGTRLPLQGRQLTPVRDVTDRIEDVRLVGLPAGNLPTLGTSNTRLEPTRVVSTSSAHELAELVLDPTWARDVWLLWARSRYLYAAGGEASLKGGTITEPIVVSARPRVELPAELRLSVDQLRAMYTIDTRVTAIVVKVSDELRRAWLRLTDGTPASVAAADIDLGGRSISEVLAKEQEVTARVKRVTEKKDGFASIDLTLREQRTGSSPVRPPRQQASRPIAATPSRQQATLSEVQALYPPGAPVSGEVDNVRADLARAWIRLGDGLTATVTAGDVGVAGVVQLERALTRGQPVTGISRGVTERNGIQVEVELRNLATPSLEQQLEEAGLVPGAVFRHGRVHDTREGVGIFVELLPGVRGVVRFSALGGRSPSQFDRGSELPVRILEAKADPRKPGKFSIRLVLA
jgi:hypothetical protein